MIKNGIIPWVVVLIFGVVVGAVIGIEFGVSYAIQDSMKVADNATCTPKQLKSVWYSNVYLTMDCNGTEYWSLDKATIMAWGNERKIPACALFKTGRARCVEQSQS